MRVSECIEKVRHELAEPSESEWKNAELVSYANDGFAIAWRLASELNHPIVERTDSVTFGAGVVDETLPYEPLRVISVSLPSGSPIAYRRPYDIPAVATATAPTLWTLIGMDTLRIWATPIAEVILGVRGVMEPQTLLWDPVTSQDDEIPLPGAACDAIVQFVLTKAYTRAGGKPQMESSFYAQYRRDLMRLFEVREPYLETCRGDWISASPHRRGW